MKIMDKREANKNMHQDLHGLDTSSEALTSEDVNNINKTYAKMEEAMKTREVERAFFEVLLSYTSDYMLGFLINIFFVALGAWVAFYWIKHYQEEEENG
jgi:DNA-binding FadR family transcriptional regulator